MNFCVYFIYYEPILPATALNPDFWLVSQNTIIAHVWLSCIMADSPIRNTVYSGPLLTYRLGGHVPLSPLTGPSSRKFCPPPVRSLRTTWSRWSTSNYVSKWENDVKLSTFLNLTIICRPVTSYANSMRRCMSKMGTLIYASKTVSWQHYFATKSFAQCACV
jgi:hypothetical protein